MSLEEEANDNENEATSWEASVARNVMMTPRASSPFPKQTSTLEDLEPNTDNDIIDVADYSERPANDKKVPLIQTSCHNPHNDTKALPHTSKQPFISNHECSGSSTCQASQNRDLGNPPRQKISTLWMASMFEKAATQGSIQK